jgi:cytochrome c oxidase cbb3-type subunit 2
MPSYSFLAKAEVEVADPSATLRALQRVGVPYTERDIEQAPADLEAQARPDNDAGDFAERYPKAQIRDFDGNPAKVTEMDALIAYLQMLGTLVDVNTAAAQEELAAEKGR